MFDRVVCTDIVAGLSSGCVLFFSYGVGAVRRLYVFSSKNEISIKTIL